MTDDEPTRWTWIRVPVIEPLRIANCWEHTPLDYYRYGEYPRFLRPVDAHQPRWRWMRVTPPTPYTEPATDRALAD